MSCYARTTAMFLLFQSLVNAQNPFVIERPIGGGMIAVINTSDTEITTPGFDFFSEDGTLIPASGGFKDVVSNIDPAISGDLSGSPTPFDFLLSNTPSKVTYGSLGSPRIFPAGSCTPLSVGVQADGVLTGSWGEINPELMPVVFVEQTTCSVPEPSSWLLVVLGLTVPGYLRWLEGDKR